MRRVGIRYEGYLERFFLNVEPLPGTDKWLGKAVDLPDEVVARYLAVIEQFDEVQEELSKLAGYASYRRQGR